MTSLKQVPGPNPAATNQFQNAATSLSPTARVMLFTVDLSNCSPPGGIYRWTPEPLPLSGGGGLVAFNGEQYEPLPIKTSGFAWTGQGALPRPKLQIGNANGVLTGYLIAFGDFRGAKVTRIVTYRAFLDDGSMAGEYTAHYLPEIFYVNRKTHHSIDYIELELASQMDVDNLMLPSLICVRDNCLHSYRTPNGSGGFNYTNVTCPYTGAASFDATGTATAAANDSCGRKLPDCRLRFGRGGVLPMRCFKGMVVAT